MYAWDPDGDVDLDAMICRKNVALDQAGCFYATGRAVVRDGVVMQGNEGESGGCICEYLLLFVDRKYSMYP